MRDVKSAGTEPCVETHVIDEMLDSEGRIIAYEMAEIVELDIWVAERFHFDILSGEM